MNWFIWTIHVNEPVQNWPTNSFHSFSPCAPSSLCVCVCVCVCVCCVCNGDCFGAVVFTSVTMIAYQDHLNAGFSKVCEVYAIEFCCIVEVNICCSKLAWRRSLMDDLLVLHQPVIVGTSTLQSEKSFRSLKLFSFPASFAYLNPFQQWLYDFYIHFFSYWRQLRDSYATITETCHSTHILFLFCWF